MYLSIIKLIQFRGLIMFLDFNDCVEWNCIDKISNVGNIVLEHGRTFILIIRAVVL